MGRSVRAILLGLLLAILAAAAVAKSFGLPLAEIRSGEMPIWHLLRTCLPIAAFALPGTLTAILLAEERRVRGLSYWLFIGLLLAAIGFFTLVYGGPQLKAAFLSPKVFSGMMAMGLIGGLIYWMMAGKKSGHLLTALAAASKGGGLDEHGLRKRCRLCSALALVLGLLPLALIGWYMIYHPSPMLPAAIAAKAETDGTHKLADSGLPWVKFAIDNHVGRVSGTASDEATRTSAFEKAKTALAPMIGIPGVVAYLQNDISVQDGSKSAPIDVNPNVADGSAANATGAAEAKRKADDEAEAKSKAVDEARLAAEAKRKADDEAAARAKAIAEARLTALAAEARRKVDEETAARKAKAAAEARAAAEAKQREDDQKRLAEELSAQKKADELARQAAEAEAERRAVDAAHKAEAEKLASEAEAKRQADAKAAAKKLAEALERAQPAPAPVATSPSPAPDAQCPVDFSELFRSGSIRFGFRSAKISLADAGYLDRIAALAKRCGGYSLSIGGHSDRSGVDAFNQGLSLARATAVRDALVARGIAKERIATQGYAGQRPFDPSNSRSAYALNRRVDFGANLTPAIKTAAKQAVVTPVAVAAPPPPQLPANQCNAEFSRAFLADTIRFAGSSAVVADSYAGFIDRIATLALSCPSHKIAVGGHTDRRGSAAYNQALSEERANAVRDALIDRDVPEGRVTASGYAGERPFDPGKSLQAFALNRRVDFGVSIVAPR